MTEESKLAVSDVRKLGCVLPTFEIGSYAMGFRDCVAGTVCGNTEARQNVKPSRHRESSILVFLGLFFHMSVFLACSLLVY